MTLKTPTDLFYHNCKLMYTLSSKKKDALTRASNVKGIYEK